MSGRLIGVAGPSGVGKDTVMQGISAACPSFGIVRRTITRAPGLGGEDYDAVTEQQFERMLAAGAFCVDWQAHGLRYGIPASLAPRLRDGEDLLVNLSRGVLRQVAAKIRPFTVLSITAHPDTLARRLAGRGRESAGEIRRRIGRSTVALPPELDIVTVSNDGAPEETVRQALSLLRREGVL